ncbi:MAG TPA: 2-C-methyl-D-erythritol 4-phosphate cytidylyltransferase [Thermomicrobiales bacterium]|nr:2-C-methyl-D-erythritol 4-phosphate cytidylyltransferase [Thermomicrobiales bacterium]
MRAPLGPDERGAWRFSAIIAGAGAGVRFGESDKVFAPLAGRPILVRAVDAFALREDVDALVVVLGAHTLERGRALIRQAIERDVIVCEGGPTRAASVLAGLRALPDRPGLVAVHDAARPLVTSELIGRTLAAARDAGAAAPALPVTDTIHELGLDGTLAGTLDREVLRAAQTPQIARRDWLEHALRLDGPATDEAGQLRAAGYPVRVVDGDPDNLKLTWPGDLPLAELILAHRLAAAS